MLKFIFLWAIILISANCAAVSSKHGDTFTIGYTYSALTPFSEVESVAAEQCSSDEKPELVGVLEEGLGVNNAMFKCVPNKIKRPISNNRSISNLPEAPTY